MTPDAGPDRGAVCAVVVTYRPDAGFPERLRRIAAQAGRTVVVDNGSGGEFQSSLAALCAESGGRVEAILNPTNLGIAAALNRGARRARGAGFGWLLTFDQDTRAADALLDSLLRAYAEAAASGPPVAAAAANYQTLTRARAGYPEGGAGGASFLETSTIITSGCLVPMAALEAVGPFREDFFIDYVDTEWGFRARALGWRLVATRAPLMDHEVGRPARHRLLGRTLWTTNYPAWRWRWRGRNLVAVSRLYHRREGAWVRGAWLTLLVTAAKILLLEPDKAAKLGGLGRGLAAGLRVRPQAPAGRPGSDRPWGDRR